MRTHMPTSLQVPSNENAQVTGAFNCIYDKAKQRLREPVADESPSPQLENLIQFKHSISLIDPPRKVRSSQEQGLSRWIQMNVARGHMGLVALEDDLLHSCPRDLSLPAVITQIPSL